MANAAGWITHFLKEISTEFVTSVGNRRKSGIVECRPIGHRPRCCDGMNDAHSSSLDCLNRLSLILRQTVVPNDRTVFKHRSDNGDVPMSCLCVRYLHFVQYCHSCYSKNLTEPFLRCTVCNVVQKAPRMQQETASCARII